MVRAYSVYAFCPYLNVMQYFYMLYMSKNIAKLGTFELSQKVVYTTHLWNPKRERLRCRNQCHRDRHAAERAQQREARLVRGRVTARLH